MSDYRPGDVLKHQSKNRFLRVLDPGWVHDGHLFVRDSDGAGFELGQPGRWLTESHLTRTYGLHYRPNEVNR